MAIVSRNAAISKSGMEIPKIKGYREQPLYFSENQIISYLDSAGWDGVVE